MQIFFDYDTIKNLHVTIQNAVHLSQSLFRCSYKKQQQNISLY